jgi:hypothetical protein
VKLRLSGGYVLLGGDDATAIARFALMWSDLLDALGRAAT